MAAKGRIEVQCPHCGNIQLEPELAKSTYCRKCSGYIQLGKGRKSSEPQEPKKHPGVFQKLEGSWRGLKFLLDHSETSDKLKIKVFNVTKKELLRDLQRAPAGPPVR